MTDLGPLKDIPIACTLMPSSGREQLARWRRFDDEYGLSRESDGDGLVIRYAKVPDSTVRLRELVAGESQCCSFVEWEIDESRDDLRLVVRGAPDALAALNVESWSGEGRR